MQVRPEPPSRLPFRWPPSRRFVVAAALVLVAAVGGGALLAVATRPAPVGAEPSPTAGPTPTERPTPSERPTPTASPSPSPTPEPQVACPWNGLPVDDPGLLDLTTLAVQIENHPGARPARNLGKADMVVEATVEGDVTRYTGFYLCRPTEGLTGPVRSARYYTIDQWQDLHVLPYFFGAHYEALDRFAVAGMPYVNGITGAWPWFQRYGSAGAPHNLYTDLEAARAAFGTNGRLQDLAARVPKRRPPFAFDAAAEPPAGREVAGVELWTNGYWHFGWDWNETERRWERDEAGVPHVDAGTGEVLSARSVIVQLVVEDVVWGPNDPAGNPRRFHHLVGSGSGTLYVDGRAVAVRWSRPAAADGTTWTYADGGAAVTLPPGVVWWEIVPLSTRVVEAPG